MPSKRDPVIVLARITGMMLIVLCHVTKYYPFIPMYSQLGEFFNCGVQLFLFVSGYLYGAREPITVFKEWYIKRFFKIAYPAIVLSFIVIVALLITGEDISINSVVAYLLDLEGLLFISWKFSRVFSEIHSLGPLWFTTIIMICYILVLFLENTIKNEKKSERRIIGGLVFATAIAVLLSSQISLLYFVVFSTGYYMGSICLLDRIEIKFFTCHTIMFMMMCIIRVILQRVIDNTFMYLAFVRLSIPILGTWFICLFAYLYNKWPSIINKIANTPIVKKAEEYSYYIYLTHGVFCMGAFNVYDKFGLPIASVLFVTLTAISSIMLKNICLKSRT